MKLLSRLIVLLAGGVQLPAVLAGRVASQRGADVLRVLQAEAGGAAVGLLVAAMLLGLGRKRRALTCQAFSDAVCLLLGLLWLVLFVAPLLGQRSARWWAGGQIAWTVLAAATLVTYVAQASSPASPPRPRARSQAQFKWPDQEDDLARTRPARHAPAGRAGPRRSLRR
jgi:hypothetical protein